MKKGKSCRYKASESDVLRFFLEDGSWLAIRPSGTEPKCKFYYEAVDQVKEKAQNKPDMFHATTSFICSA